MIELISLLYSEERFETYDKFFDLLPDLLPCRECGEHLKQYYHLKQPQLDCKQSIVRRVHKFHNFNNKQLWKEKYTLDEFVEKWDDIAEGAKFAAFVKWKIKWEDVQQAVRKSVYNKLSDMEKVDAILSSVPNTFFSLGKIYVCQWVDIYQITI